MKSETQKGHESIDTYLNKPVHELSPELANKIWKSVQQRNYENQVSKEQVLHHLKQIKAQMGKLRKTYNLQTLKAVNEIIDKKIAKVKGK